MHFPDQPARSPADTDGVRPLSEISDVEELRTRARVLEASNAQLAEQLRKLTARVSAMEAGETAPLLKEIEQLKKRIENQVVPGNKSEKRGKPEKKERAPQTGHGPTEQPSLPVKIETHVLDEADCQCPDCGKPLKAWEGKFEESEEIDVVVRQHVRKVHRKQKYQCSCGHIETALGPVRLIPGGRYSTEFALQVVVQKFLDHIPLERQVRMLAREGLKVESQTLWDQEYALYLALIPVEKRLIEFIAGQKVRCADETRWPVFGSETKNWTMWVVAVAQAVHHSIKEGRSEEEAVEMLQSPDGYWMVDGYGVYPALAKKRPQMKLVHCWAHVRRHFLDVETAFPTEVARMLDLVGQLFHIEKDGPADELGKRRTERSKDVVASIRNVLETTPSLPGSGLRGALEYTQRRWSGLTRFLEDPDIPLTNNLAERSLRGPVVGRKNFYGARSERGTNAAALFYSLFESAKLVGVDPVAYLREATRCALGNITIPLPHEFLADGGLLAPH